MKEHPILFNSAMVRAILDGSKMQTRRNIKSQPIPNHRGKFNFPKFTDDDGIEPFWQNLPFWHARCPFGKVGDQLWVRETFQPVFADGREYGINTPNWKTGEGYEVTYPATDKIIEWIDGDDNITDKCKPSIHMPRWASRIQLEITDIRVERLQDISEEDAKAEGVMQLDCENFERPSDHHKNGLKLCPTCAGTGLHNALGANLGVIYDVDCTDCDTHAKLFKHLWNSTGGDWDANPYVWCISFRKVNQ